MTGCWMQWVGRPGVGWSLVPVPIQEHEISEQMLLDLVRAVFCQLRGRTGT